MLFDDQTFGGTRRIVGIVGDARVRAVAEAGRPMIFLPHAQYPTVFRPTLVVRSSLPPEAMARSVRARLEAADPSLLVRRIRPMTEVVSGALSRPRFNLLLIGAFAAVALGLAAVGIYGVVAMVVAERTREVGIRIALGAGRTDVLWLLAREGIGPVAAGTAAGLAGAAGVTTALGSLLFGVARFDPASYAAALCVTAAAALCACYLPARRALTLDPAATLRDA